MTFIHHSSLRLKIQRIHAVLAAVDEDTQCIGHGSCQSHNLITKLAMYVDKILSIVTDLIIIMWIRNQYYQSSDARLINWYDILSYLCPKTKKTEIIVARVHVAVLSGQTPRNIRTRNLNGEQCDKALQHIIHLALAKIPPAECLSTAEVEQRTGIVCTCSIFIGASMISIAPCISLFWVKGPHHGAQAIYTLNLFFT